jgi:hypothetical protein
MRMPGACSSVGRAPDLHSGGRRFETGQVHSLVWNIPRDAGGVPVWFESRQTAPAKQQKSFFDVLEDCWKCRSRKRVGLSGDNTKTSCSYVFKKFTGAPIRVNGSLSCVIKKNTVKLLRAHGGCLGNRRRRRTRLPAISLGETEAVLDPGISEWENPSRVMSRYCMLNT